MKISYGHLRIFFNQDKSKINDSSDYLPSDKFLLFLCEFDNVHSIRASKIVDVKVIAFFPEQVKRIIAISLKTSSFVNCSIMISIENSPFSIFFPKSLLESLSDAVYIITCNLSSNL